VIIHIIAVARTLGVLPGSVADPDRFGLDPDPDPTSDNRPDLVPVPDSYSDPDSSK
jgi:hypothetical protein